MPVTAEETESLPCYVVGEVLDASLEVVVTGFGVVASSVEVAELG